MENKKWLPSDTRNRLIDLCKDRNISQAQLAGVIGIDRSALSRFLSGKTDSMSHEHVIAIAKYFNVSTDFLLGENDDPGRINYDIGELGLTVKAAECLYTRKVDPAILCKLLEQERCGDLMHEIGLYLDETMASGIAAQNQLFNSLSNLLNEHAAEHPEDKRAADAAAQTVLAIGASFSIKDGILTDPEGAKRRISPKSATEFFMEGLPEILCFEENGSVKLCGQQIIPQWSETGTVYTRETKQNGE